MSFVNGLKEFGFKSLQMLLAFIMWLAIIILIFNAIIFLKTEHYQATDSPNPKFQVAIVTANNSIKPIYWHELNNQTLAVTPDETCVEDCLMQKADTFIYHNEGAMWTSESEYKIIDQKAQPVSYSFYSLNEGIQAFIFSYIGYAIVKYAFLRFWYRRLPNKVRELNQANLKGVKSWSIFILVVITFYTILYFMKVA